MTCPARACCGKSGTAHPTGGTASLATKLVAPLNERRIAAEKGNWPLMHRKTLRCADSQEEPVPRVDLARRRSTAPRASNPLRARSSFSPSSPADRRPGFRHRDRAPDRERRYGGSPHPAPPAACGCCGACCGGGAPASRAARRDCPEHQLGRRPRRRSARRVRAHAAAAAAPRRSRAQMPGAKCDVVDGRAARPGRTANG